MESIDTTYRVVVIGDRDQFGPTALTPDLAKLAAGSFLRTQRLGIERTEWAPHFDKIKAIRTVLIEAEDHPGQWVLGPQAA